MQNGQIVPKGKKVYVGGTLYRAGASIHPDHVKMLSSKIQDELSGKKRDIARDNVKSAE